MADGNKKLNLQRNKRSQASADGFAASDKSGQADEKLKVLSLKIPEHLHRKLKYTASLEGTTITKKLTDWIEQM